jgi:hypothetical protein
MHRNVTLILLCAVGSLLPMGGCFFGSGDQSQEVVDQPPADLPAVLDLLPYQTSIRNQGGRDVCPYFPPVAALEAAYRRSGTPVELSEEHLIWLRNVTCAGDNPKRDVAENLISTLGGGNGMGVLSTYAICRLQDLPYQQSVNQDGFGLEKYDWSKPFPQFVLNRWNFDPHQLSTGVRSNARYSIGKYVTMPPEDLRDPRKFEEILASKHEIIFTLVLHNDIYKVDPTRPVWRFQPGSQPIGLHFMLMVGYDSARKFFIVKNQWGPTNYSGQKDRLAEGWKDIVRYDGYTLVDYNYLVACGEGHYITEIVPVDSPRFDSQRALGQWDVTFQEQDKPVMTGVLCWRRLPSDESGKLALPVVADRAKTTSPELRIDGQKANFRIGDLVTADGQEFRVNARFNSDGTKPLEVSLAIDFDTGALPAHSMAGTTWTGSLTLPQSGEGSMSLSPVADARQMVFGVPVSNLKITAGQVSDRNLLKTVKPSSLAASQK